jgi:hypothetical protein
VELALRVADVELDEGAGQPLLLPRRGGFAGQQADDDVADPHRLAGPQRQVARLAVALVHKAENGDPLGHRRRARRDLGHGLVDADDLGLVLVGRRALWRAPGSAGGQRPDRGERQRHAQETAVGHAQSGVQAS